MNQQLNEIRCPQCGLAYTRFTQTWHSRCEACYPSFQKQLQPVLADFRRRLEEAEDQGDSQQLNQLVREAIALEEYEAAGRILEQLKAS